MAQNNKKDHKAAKKAKVVFVRFRAPADQLHVEEEGERHGGRPEYLRELVRQDRIAKQQKKKP